MMIKLNYQTIFLGLLISGLYACNDNLSIVPSNETILRGNICKLEKTTDTPLPSEALSTLADGSQMLLNASGSLQINNQVFTYSNNHWTSDTPIRWLDSNDESDLTALYPVPKDYTYSTHEALYPNNSLSDILYVKEKCPARSEIMLQFKHLFSMLTFQVSEELQKKLITMELTTPLTVSSVSPTSAAVTLDTQKSHTTAIPAHASNEYHFIVPPAENMSLNLMLKTTDKVYTIPVKAQNYISNHQYKCHLKTDKEQIGISSVEDLITFAHLIGGEESYKGKTLNDFGSTVNGVTTYRLLNDITFTKEESKLFIPIGTFRYEFEGVFDGKGHTISNLTIPSKLQGGLFGYVAKNGVVKNLNLKESSFIITEKSQAAGLFIKKNLGIVTNCHIENCKITSKDVPSIYTGILAGIAGNTIMNCSVKSCTISAGANIAGGLVGSGLGLIINSFSADNTITTSAEKGYICGKSNINSIVSIINCYVKRSSISGNKSGAFIGNAEAATVIHSFYNKGAAFANGGSATDTYTFDSNFMYNNDISVLSSLNEWVSANLSTYPELKAWTKGDDIAPAIFLK